MTSAIPRRHMTFAWLKGEMDQSLEAVRERLQRYGTEEQAQALQEAAEGVHELHGILLMAEGYGAALLAEEVEQTIRVLASGKASQPEETYQLLVRAVLALESYLERLYDARPDTPVVLLPLLNDLRAARNENLLTENALFQPDLTAVPPEQSEGRGEAAAALAKQLRPYYQAGLLAWFRDADSRSLRQLGAVIDRLERASSGAPGRRLWWVAGGLLDALRDQGVETSISVKLLLGHVDRQIKHLADEGEGNFLPPTDLLKNLLYYVGRAECSSKRVSQLKEAFDLAEALPTAERMEATAKALTGAQAAALESIAQTLKEGLLQVKSMVDAFLRDPAPKPEQLRPALEILRQTADTLSVLGIGKIRRLVLEQRVVLASLANGKKRDRMLDFAQALLHVEGVLDHLHVYLGLAREPTPGTDNATDVAMEKFPLKGLPESEYRQIVNAAIRESRANITEVKNNVMAFVTTAMKQKTLFETPRLLQEVEGVLRMLALEHAADLVEATRRYVTTELLGRENRPSAKELDLFAEGVVGLEYYLEAVAEQRPPFEPILAMTRRCLKGLGYAVEAPPGEQDLPVQETTGGANDEQSPETETNQAAAEPQTTETPAEEPEPQTNVVALPVEDIDEEVIEIFVEEANEALSDLRRHLHALRLGATTDATLNLIRHTFHTLKGSGRIAGAYAISDFATALEDMVSAMVHGVVPRDERAMGLLAKTYPMLDELVANFGQGRAAPREAMVLAEQARKLRDEAAAAAPMPAAPPQEEPEHDEEDELGFSAEDFAAVEALFDEEDPAPAEQAQADETDAGEDNIASAEPPDLMDSFVSEALAGLGKIQQFLTACQDKPGGCRIPESLAHTVHSISMNARTLGVQEISELGELLENYIKRMGKSPATRETVEILDEFCDMTSQLLRGLREDQPETDDQAPEELRERIERAENVASESPEPEYTLEQTNESEQPEDEDDSAPVLMDSIAPAEEEAALSEAGASGVPDQVEEELQTTEEDLTVIDLFLEEAGELLDVIGEILADWPDNADTDTLEALQRALHTIKGSARMAGITPVADLSHAVESMADALLAGELQPTPQLNGLLQHAIDNLNEMRERLQANGIPFLNDQLLTDIDELLRSGQADEAPETQSTSETTDEAPQELTAQEVQPAPEPDRHSEPMAELAAEPEAASEAKPEAEPATVPEAEPALEQVEEPIAERRAAETLPTMKPGEVAYDFDTAEPDVAAASAQGKKPESVRIGAELLDELVNYANEENILNKRVDEQLASLRSQLEEMENTVARLHGQLRDFEAEAGNEGLFPAHTRSDGFDPLELDRFTEAQRLAHALGETLGDLTNIQETLAKVTDETDGILQQKAKVHKDLQEGLLGSRMVPFAKQAQRLARLVRQTATELDKQAQLHLEGTQGKLDRALLDRIMGPLEHIVRNALAHGIESAEARKQAGKPREGNITISLTKESAENVLRISDDGAGVDLAAVRAKALEKGLIDEDNDLSDEEVLHLILEPGFSTATKVTQVSGRGIGMDVVNSEIQALGGTLFISTEKGRGTTFTIHLPFTMAMNHALLVEVGEHLYAIPSASVDSVEQIDEASLEALYTMEDPVFEWQGRKYSFRYLGALLDTGRPGLSRDGKTLPLILISSNEQHLALHVDALLGSREIMIKSGAPQLNHARGIAGATVLGDGRVALILDMGAMMRAAMAKRHNRLPDAQRRPAAGERVKVLVVDDSITVRKVTERFLARHNMDVITVKDGMEAVQLLEEKQPDIILLDIEMPRMDGFEVATQVRKDPRWTGIPIIMITSRTGRKHREHAERIGVDRFLGKPYQEAELLEHIRAVTRSA